MADNVGPEQGQSPLNGILWMLATGASFVGVLVCVKIVGDAVPAPEAAFLRFLFGLVFLVPTLVALMRDGIGRGALMLHGWRGLVHAAGVICWFYAMTRIPLAEVTAMNYLNPVYVTIGAALVFGERLALRRIIAIVVAFAGVLVILRPGFREVSDGHIAMLFTALFFGASYLLAKKLSERESAAVVVAMMSVTVTVLLAPIAIAVWVWPTPGQAVWLFLVAAFGTAGHYTMTRAFRAAPLTVTQPVTFLQLVWAVLLGWLVFEEPVDIWVLLGGVMIVGAVVFITWREAVTRRQTRTPPPEATKM
ncbi:drug/metabolite transporter (DMT)-like permease [Rhodovulum bhavnagarense]|uniref:Drug/metabolite transporter (DMT)-like permease n=1 Tax=Rhodovulum bhavnagarense TaxID=992286 RepID=A0A4R2RL76_9RHOB|nr:DMT family transporter [Rhodovulum bhavnagarense]TCP62967.1 drug/metabolite transporter (DMT)-like permease [Rhodovulum bhavnagarense]